MIQWGRQDGLVALAEIFTEAKAAATCALVGHKRGYFSTGGPHPTLAAICRRCRKPL